MFSDTRSHASQAGLGLPIQLRDVLFIKAQALRSCPSPRNNEWQGHLFPRSSGYSHSSCSWTGWCWNQTPSTQVHPVGSTVSLITGGFQSRESIRLRFSISTSQPLVILSLSAREFLAMRPHFGWLIWLFLSCPSRLPRILPCLA